MAKEQTKLVKRRRFEGKTDYKKRLILLKSNALRFVVRKSNRYILIQIVESKRAQDRVLYTVTSKELLKYRWPEDKSGSLKSISASYLTGYLISKKVGNKENFEKTEKSKFSKGKIILDSGLITSTKGSRVYAALKGASDAGLKIPFNEEIMPSKEKIEKDNFNKVKGEIDKKWQSKK